MEFIVGIDPGLDGGIVVLDAEGGLHMKEVLPTYVVTKGKRSLDLRELRDIFNTIGCKFGWHTHFFLEKVGAMPGQGVSSMFKMGRGYGSLEAMIVAFQFSYELVPPTTWTKVIHKGLDKKMKPKERSLLVLKRKYPSLDLTATERSKKPHEGLMDALLIAEYGRGEVLSRLGENNGRRERRQGIKPSRHNESSNGAENRSPGSDSSGSIDLL